MTSEREQHVTVEEYADQLLAWYGAELIGGFVAERRIARDASNTPSHYAAAFETYRKRPVG